MCGEVKRIDFIKNMAIFQDFQWASSVKDENNDVLDFKKINIIYGRNYSGKTTLSRIIRALETGYISNKFTAPEFQLSFDDGTKVTQNSLTNHSCVVRVFNEDFVKENLRFIINDEDGINAFAILGEDNTKLEEEIKELEKELGSEESKTGLIGKWVEAKQKYVDVKKAHDDKVNEVESRLRDKANKPASGIKHNKLFGDANYNVKKIKADIDTVTSVSYNPITDEDARKYEDLLKEESKKEIKESQLFDLKYFNIASKAQELIEKKIQPSEPIQELLNDAALAAWVRSGREYHEGKRNRCAFCGNDLPADLWEKLDKHFNQESEELRKAIDELMALIKTEKQRVPYLLNINVGDFYTNFASEADALQKEFKKQAEAYIEALDSIKKQLQARKDDIFKPISFVNPEFEEERLNLIRDSYEKLRQQSNEFTNQLSAKQHEARIALRLYEVFKFVTDIKYSDEQAAIERLREDTDKAQEEVLSAQSAVNSINSRIDELKSKLKDERMGAEKVNHYLNNFFGHDSLSLKAIKETTDGTTSGYKFEVTRDDEKAFHLSEGEASLISFCYFMAKLEDIETKGKQPIIWIDDPISSLDSNHIFFIYSLINSEIFGERNEFRQLFISTHNLDFLKYLKRLPGANQDERKGERKKKYRYLVVERCDKISMIKLMPKYLRDYVTEFNYLFEQIYKCASIDSIDDSNYTTFYNFGNNARKFFEIYLYYKYPDQGMTEETLRLFFGKEKIPAVLTDRINNEYSHLAGVFERGSTPVEVPEMQKTARQIIHMLKKDKAQYSALLKSIGVEEVSASFPPSPVGTHT